MPKVPSSEFTRHTGRVPIAIRLLMLMVLGLLATPAEAQVPVIYVNGSLTTGANNGTSWADAFRGPSALQLALVSGTTEIWIAHGTYRPAPGVSSPASTFTVNGFKIIRGGFAGTETYPADRSSATPPTILSGDNLGNDGPNLLDQAVWTNISDNAYHVVTVTTSSFVTLDRLTIMGGNAVAAPAGQQGGGGVYASSVGGGMSLTVNRCVFIRNQASSNGGGAILFTPAQGSPLVVHASRFLGNRARFGGAIAGYLFVIRSCEFSGNWADGAGGPPTGYGGAIYSDQTLFSNAKLFTQCTFTGNVGVDGSAIYSHPNVSVQDLTGCISWGNRSTSFSPPTRNSISVPAPSVLTSNHIQHFMPNGQNGNLDSDPLLVDADGPDNQFGTLDDNPRLTGSSSCRDSGLFGTSQMVFPSPTDAAGNQRAPGTPSPIWGPPDRGAYEFGSVPYPPRLYALIAPVPPATGASWASAMSVSQAMALYSVAGDEIAELWAGAGAAAGTLSRQHTTRVYGGFAGTETSIAQRVPSARTTLSSSSLQITDPSGFAAVVADGFVFAGTTPNDLSCRTVSVGNCSFESSVTSTVPSGLTASNCIFNASLTTTSPHPFAFSNCQFARTVSTGIRQVRVTGTGTFTDCSFTDLISSNPPAGAFECSSGTVTLRSCSFTGVADQNAGGAVLARNTGRVNLVKCTFNDCRVPAPGGYGGAVAAQSGGIIAAINCTFTRNLATGGSALGNMGGTVDVTNCIIIANTSPAGVPPGGSPATLGSAVWASGGRITLTSCTVAGNAGSAGYGGVVVEGPVTSGSGIYNSVLWGNIVPPSLAGQIAAPGAGAGPTIDVADSIIEHWVASPAAHPGVSGAAFPADPLLFRIPNPGPDLTWRTSDDDLGDVRLGFHSPAIDAGDNSRLPADAHDLDADGNVFERLPRDAQDQPRFLDDPSTPDSGVGTPPLCDIGALEFQLNCPECPGPCYWRAAGGGPFSSAASWYPTIPDETRDVVFDVAAAYDVDFPAGTISNRSARLDRGTVTFGLAGASYVVTETARPSLVLGSVPGAAAVLRIEDGLLSVIGARIGSHGGAVGSVEVAGSASELVAARDVCIGCDGEGSLSITMGGYAVMRNATVGDQPGSLGQVTVADAGSVWDLPFFLIIDSGEVVVRDGGTVSTGFGTFLFNDGRIVGNGTINGPVVNFGRVAPGASLASDIGTLTVNDSYNQIGSIPAFGAASGSLEMQIAGAGPGQFDRLVVNAPANQTDGASLGGGMFVSFVNGFQPVPADTFRVLETGSTPIVGQFDVIFFPALTAAPVQGKFLRAQYSGLRGPGGNGITVGIADLPPGSGFGAPQPTALSGAPAGAAAGDLDRDGDIDLAVALPGVGGMGAGSIAILLNDGSGGFAVNQISSGGVEPRALAIANFDGLNGNDIAVANAGSDEVRVLRQMTVAGTFGDAVVVPLPAGSRPVTLAAADFDVSTPGNLGVDLAIGNEDPGSDRGSIALARNTGGGGGGGGGGGFAAAIRVPLPAPMTRPLDIRPINPDRDKDVDLGLSYGSDPGPGGSGTVGGIALFANVGGTGIFGPNPPAGVLQTGPDPVQLLAGDLGVGGAGEAGGEDLVTVNRGGTLGVADGNSVSVLRNNGQFDENDPAGSPGFAPAVSYAIQFEGASVPSEPRSIALADLDDDGDLDIAVVGSVSAAVRRVKILRNDSTRVGVGAQQVEQVAFAPQVEQQASGDCPERILAADVSGDGRRDLITVNASCTRGTPNEVRVAGNTMPPLALSLGACCGSAAGGGQCVLATAGACTLRGDSFLGAMTACAPNPCPQPPAACCRGSTCVIADSVACAAFGPFAGYAGAGSACNTPGNQISPCCLADFNRSGSVSVQDIFDFLGAYFAGEFTLCDINSSGTLSVQDIFDFLAAFFSGCE